MATQDIRTDPRLLAELRTLLGGASGELRDLRVHADTAAAARGSGSPTVADALAELERAIVDVLVGLAARARETVALVEANHADYDRAERGIVEAAQRIAR